MQFTAITPSYQSSSWLRLCAASVADQEKIESEHIIQDNESDDGTLDWLVNDKRVRAFVEKDRGMYDALNRGLRRARGAVLGWLNCDEQYLPGTLAAVCGFFKRHPSVDVLFGDAILVNENGAALSYRRVVQPRRSHTRLVHLGTMSCATFFRRWIVDEGILFDSHWRAIGDAVWMDALFQRGVRMACLPEPLAVFTFTGSNLGATERSREEAVAWSLRGDAPPGWKRPPAVLMHWLRKALAGAYRRRTLDYEIYTQQSPAKRIRFHAGGLGFGWPSGAALDARL